MGSKYTGRPDKTRRVNLWDGKQGFDFLGCHLRKRFSGPVWLKYGKRRHYLQRWPSTKSMKRIRTRVKELTPKSRSHEDPRAIIARLNPVLRGWGQYFRTGNATHKFCEVDKYVVWRLRRMRIHRKGRHLKAGESRRWRSSYFTALGLYHLHGTIKYPGTAQCHFPFINDRP